MAKNPYRLSCQFVSRYGRPSGKAIGSEEGGRVGGEWASWLLTVVAESCCCCMTRRGVWWEEAKQHLWHSASSTHAPTGLLSLLLIVIVCWLNAHPHTQRERACEPRRYCIQFLINVLGGRPLCYPSPSPRNLLQRGQASEPSSFMHHSVCVLLPSIGISRVTSARYRRRSLSHDIVAMCGWRSISRYRLIDIIPSVYVGCPRLVTFYSDTVTCYELYCRYTLTAGFRHTGNIQKSGYPKNPPEFGVNPLKKSSKNHTKLNLSLSCQ